MDELMNNNQKDKNPRKFSLVVFNNINKLLCRVWYGFKMTDQCTVPQTGAVILVANHRSAIDPAILCAAIEHRNPSFLIAKEFSDIPLLRFFVRLIECIPVKRNSRDVNATKASIRRLRAGKMIAVFIQGGISIDGQRRELKNGAALLAMRTGATVIPTYISGTTHRKNIFIDVISRHKARVKFGRPFKLSNITENGKKRETLSLATELIYSKIVALGQNG